MTTMPAQRPHRSEQTVETPADLIEAIRSRFGPIAFDLAATKENAKASYFFSKDQDSLRQDWSQCSGGNLWLNPPYTKIGDWAEKCASTIGGPHFCDRILLLVPASVGSNWYAKHIHGKAHVFALTGRAIFVGHNKPYPKDLILCSYGDKPGFECWSWKTKRATVSAADRTLRLPFQEPETPVKNL